MQSEISKTQVDVDSVVGEVVMSQVSSNIRSFQELSHRYAERIGRETKDKLGTVQRKVDDLSKSRKLDEKIESLKGELSELNKRGQQVISELGKLSNKVSEEIKKKISRA